MSERRSARAAGILGLAVLTFAFGHAAIAQSTPLHVPIVYLKEAIEEPLPLSLVEPVATDNGLAGVKLAIGDNYWPGMGLITGFVLLFVVGLAVNAFLVRRLLGIGEELLLRVPVVKTVYSAIRDMTRLVNTDKKKGDLDRVVTLDLGFGMLIGFVTQEHANTIGIGGGDDLVAVYLPMSYQIGGYTVYLPRSRLVETDLTVEQAMRIVLTGGVRGK